jgi:outer membrane protein
MKTSVSKLIKTGFAIAIVATFAACNNQPKTDSKTSAAPVSTPEKAEIVYVNSDTLVHNYEYAKDMSKRLQDKGKAANDDVVSKKQAFQREVGDYQKGAQSMSAEQRAPIEQKLQRKGQEIQAYEQNASAEFQNETQSEQSKLYDKIADFAKQYAKEKGYKLVLTYSKANPTVLFGDPSLDVTADVVKRLNDLYAKEKK